MAPQVVQNGLVHHFSAFASSISCENDFGTKALYGAADRSLLTLRLSISSSAIALGGRIEPPRGFTSSVGDRFGSKGVHKLPGLHDGRTATHQPRCKHGGNRVALAFLTMNAAHGVVTAPNVHLLEGNLEFA